MNQVHTKFKVFSGDPAADKTIGGLAKEIENFVAETKVAAKSIGVEYMENAGRLIMTLGYRDDQPAYLVNLHCVSIGKLSDTNDLSHLETLMQEAAEKQENIICHELYITDEQEFFMVFMTQAS